MGWARASRSRSTASTVAPSARARGDGRRARRRGARHTGARPPRPAALDTIGLSAEEDPERPGVWTIAGREGAVEAVLRDTGESLLLMRALEYAGGDGVEALRWLLLASDWGSARMGMAMLPGGPGLFSVCAVPAASLEPQALAWGVAEVLQLSDEYDRLAAG
jgi:hypothetical protein